MLYIQHPDLTTHGWNLFEAQKSLCRERSILSGRMANLRAVQQAHAMHENKLNQTLFQNSILCLHMGWEGYPLLSKISFWTFMQKRILTLEVQSRDQDRPIGKISSRIINQQLWLCLKTSPWERRECSRALVSELAAIEVMSPDL